MTALCEVSNLFDFLSYFKNEEICLQYLEQMRWNGNIKCFYKDCNGDKIFRIAGHKYKCNKCKRIYSIKVGTIFENTKLPLQKWYAAIYLITYQKRGISSSQLSQKLSITQKSAWLLLHRISFALGLKLRPEQLKFKNNI